LSVVACPIDVAPAFGDVRRAFVRSRGGRVRGGGVFEAVHGSSPCGPGRIGGVSGAFGSFR